jgi:flagellar hook-length control protein FliK
VFITPIHQERSMSEIMLPQVTPAPPKAPSAPAKSAEPAAETQAEPGFSEVLSTRMQPEESAETAAGKPEAAPAAAAGRQGTEAAGDGKPLPPAGNAAAAALAALTTDAAGTTEAPAVPAVAADPVQETAVALPAGIAVLFPTDPARPAPAGKAASLPTSAQGRPQPQTGPLATGARAELPQAAQESVAQAVREVLAENTETTPQRSAGETFAAQVRALATVQGRAGAADNALERLMQTPAQPAPAATAAAQVAQPVVPQDAMSTPRATLPATTLDTPFRQPGWDQALSERVMWVANQRFQGAEIKLNPPQLGPIEVRVQLQHEQAHISFTAQHASVREALEAALPRLREMFTANGFNLVDVNVSEHSFAEQQRQAQAQAGHARTDAGVDDDGASGIALHQEIPRMAATTRGGIDLFA